jgi:predicted membrane GTPase involved in stress response
MELTSNNNNSSNRKVMNTTTTQKRLMDSGQLETEGLVTILAKISTPPSMQTAGMVPIGT